jgi:hypothetical protein
MIGKEVIRVTRGKNLAEVVTSILNFNGEKGEEVGKTLLLAALRNESVESTAKNISGQTVRLHAQREEIGEKLLQRARE